MPGGIIQLVAVGSQNVFLNGNPSISFFKKVYKTYTNFASETISLIPSNNTLKFNKSTSIVVKVDRNGDLIRSWIRLMSHLPLSVMLAKFSLKNRSSILEERLWINNMGSGFMFGMS